MLNSLKKLLAKLVEPRSKLEDDKRREFILNVILISSLLLSGSAVLSIIVRVLMFKSTTQSNANSLLSIFIIFTIFLILYILSRLKKFKIASYILMILYFLPVTQALYAWGVDLPQGLLVYMLIIIFSGILINTRFAIFTTIICSGVIFTLNYLQIAGITEPNNVWRTMKFGWPDASIIAITFIVTAIIAWLSNREIEKSLKRARRSEAALKKERDSLEEKVEERTRRIKRMQLEKMEQLSHFAEVGRLASGIFHDLINPLTAVSLNLEKIKHSDKELTGSENYLQQAIQSTRHIESLMSSMKNQINLQEIRQKFNIAKTVKEVLQILSYKTRLAKVAIDIKNENEDLELFGNPLKFHQLLSNIISNAIDSYDHAKSENKKIELRILRKNKNIIIEVQDWGKGIAEQSIQKIFDPFFTTKTDKGTGLGLAITKNIIEKDFQGEIFAESNVNFGTTIKIKLPPQ